MFILRHATPALLAILLTTGPSLAQTAPGQPAPDQPPPAAAAPATEAPNSPEAMEDAQTGDHWTYELRDEITGDIKSTITNTVTDVSAAEVSTRIAALGNSNAGYQNFDRSWNLINNGVWRFTPNDGTGVKTPLAVGKTWSFKATDLNSTAGVSWKRTGTAKVVAQESVTTRAGSFDTFKIETSIKVQNANDPTKKVELVQQTWYAPLIDHWVKRSAVSRADGRVREKTTIELVEYGRR
jgi:hypothetical protein